MYSCIGTDYINDRVDPVFTFLDPSGNTSISIQELKVGDTPYDLSKFTVKYVNYVGETIENPPLKWESSDTTVLSISGNTSAIGIAHGSAYLKVSTSSEEGNTLKDSTKIRICEQSLKSIAITDGENTYSGIINDNVISFQEQLISGNNITITKLTLREGATSTLLSGSSLNAGVNALQINNPNGCTENYQINVEVIGIINKDLLSLTITHNNTDYSSIISGTSVSFSSKLPYNTTQAIIKSIKTSSGATASISGVTIQTGSHSLNVGTNIIKVTGKDGSFKNYTVVLLANAEPTSFSGSVQGGYGLRGDFTVEKTLSGIRINFAENYNLSSGLPGGYLYLSNNPNSTGLVVAGYNTTPELKYSGAHSYEINNVGITDYKYLVFWCVPFNVKVGQGKIF